MIAHTFHANVTSRTGRRGTFTQIVVVANLLPFTITMNHAALRTAAMLLRLRLSRCLLKGTGRISHILG
jgi:hypothetical protein